MVKNLWRKRLLFGLIATVTIWFAGDFSYSRYIAYRIASWSEDVPWSEDGFAPDAEEFSCGEGSVALLMIHGFSDTPQMYRKLAPALADEGYHCRSILLPGFGRSVEAYANCEIKDWHQKVADEVNGLRETHSEVWIVAHSLGGAVTIAHLLDNRSNVDGAVLITPAVAVSNKRSPLLPTRFWHEFSKYSLPFTTITCSPFEMDAKDPGEREREHRMIFSPRSIVDRTFELVDHNKGRAAEIELPVLAFLAVDDQVVDSTAIEQYYEDLSSSRKKLVRLADSGHMVPVDLEWKQVVQDIHSFISLP